MKAEVSKMDYSSKAKGSNIRDFLVANNTVLAPEFEKMNPTRVITS